MCGNLPGEMQSIRTVVAAGEKYGYGNMIHRLKMAWVLALKNDGMSWEMAASGALLSKSEVRLLLESAAAGEEILIQELRSYTGKPA